MTTDGLGMLAVAATVGNDGTAAAAAGFEVYDPDMSMFTRAGGDPTAANGLVVGGVADQVVTAYALDGDDVAGFEGVSCL